MNKYSRAGFGNYVYFIHERDEDVLFVSTDKSGRHGFVCVESSQYPLPKGPEITKQEFDEAFYRALLIIRENHKE